VAERPDRLDGANKDGPEYPRAASRSIDAGRTPPPVAGHGVHTKVGTPRDSKSARHRRWKPVAKRTDLDPCPSIGAAASEAGHNCSPTYAPRTARPELARPSRPPLSGTSPFDARIPAPPPDGKEKSRAYYTKLISLFQVRPSRPSLLARGDSRLAPGGDRAMSKNSNEHKFLSCMALRSAPPAR
jgi:hypothetical protein